jgi:PAS domain-containing protein
MSSVESPVKPNGQSQLDGVGVVHPAKSLLTAVRRILEMIAVIAIEGERSQAALKKAFLEIQTSEHRLQTILDAIPIQAWSLRTDGRVDYLNQRCLEYSGLSREEAYSSGRKGEPGRSAGVSGVEAIAPDAFQLTVHPEDAPTTLAEGEKELIEGALAASRGRISGPSGAAAKLGIPRQTLESKIKALHIDRLSFRVR